MKTLNTRKAKDFKRKDSILSRLSGENHTNPYLISLLGTYRQFESFHLIFPWEKENLLQHWKRVNPNRSPTEQREPLSRLAQRCHGMADGLRQIHRHLTASGTSLLVSKSDKEFSKKAKKAAEVAGNDMRTESRLYGRHGDIKPENILWFPTRGGAPNQKRGILKISDFGLAKFSLSREVDPARRGFVALTPTYRPPESYLERRLISSLYDTWSLGCVYLEFATWWLGGWKLVAEFTQQRLEINRTGLGIVFGGSLRSDEFFTQGEGNGLMVKRSVTEVSTYALESILTHVASAQLTSHA